MSLTEDRSVTPSPKRPRRQNRSAPKMRVLVVDDDHNILALLQTALTALGTFDISIADSGAEALRQVERADRPFDCFLLDIQMPQMNGITLCRELRSLRSYHKTPILMLTAMSERKYVDESFLAGANDYITKPFDFIELRSRLSSAQRLLEEHQRATSSIEIARKLKQELDANRAVSFDEPMGMPGVERMLGRSEFENYVMQLSQSKRFTTYVSAIKVEDAAKHYQELGTTEFRESMEEVGRALSKYTRKAATILCYRGSGIFLSVNHRKANVLRESDHDRLNRMVAAILAASGHNRPMVVDLGPAMSLRLTSKSGALYALNKAAAAVQTHNALSLPSKALSRSGANQSEFVRSERRAYEAILKDLLTEEPALNRY